MARTKEYSAKEMVDALEKTGGVVADAARKLGCSPQTVYNYINEYSTVKAAREQFEQNLDAHAEAVIYSAIVVDRDVKTAKWYKARRDERYQKKTQTDITSDGEQIQTPTSLDINIHHTTAGDQEDGEEQ